MKPQASDSALSRLPAREIVWYSRLAIWSGATILLLRAITGGATSWITALAVITMLVGLPAFIFGLSTLPDEERAARDLAQPAVVDALDPGEAAITNQDNADQSRVGLETISSARLPSDSQAGMSQRKATKE